MYDDLNKSVVLEKKKIRNCQQAIRRRKFVNSYMNMNQNKNINNISTDSLPANF